MAAKESKTTKVTYGNGVVVSVSDEKAERLLAGTGWATPADHAKQAAAAKKTADAEK